MAKEKFNVYDVVTDRILDALKEGIVPWQRPWKIEGGLHINLKSKKAYRGVNQFLLDLTAMSEGYTSPYWLSYKQAAEMGGQVRKGESSTLITFWSMIAKDKKDPNSDKFRLLRYYRVFNVAQVDGIEDKIPKVTDVAEFNPIEAAEAIIREMPNAPVIKIGGDKAYYNPSADFVALPKPESFDAPDYYYWAAFHELSHSTGHESRLKREGIMKGITFGNDSYAMEELVAQIASMFLCAQSGTDDVTFDNSASYLAGWSNALRQDEKLIVRAAGQAQKASDYILGVKYEKYEEKEGDN